MKVSVQWQCRMLSLCRILLRYNFIFLLEGRSKAELFKARGIPATNLYQYLPHPFPGEPRLGVRLGAATGSHLLVLKALVGFTS